MFFLLPAIDRLLDRQKPLLSRGKQALPAICNRVVTEAWDPEVLYANHAVLLLGGWFDCTQQRYQAGGQTDVGDNIAPQASQRLRCQPRHFLAMLKLQNISFGIDESPLPLTHPRPSPQATKPALLVATKRETSLFRTDPR